MSPARLVAFLLCAAAVAQAPVPSGWRAGALFDEVAAVLERRYHDAAFRREALPALVETFRGPAAAAESPAEERAVIHAFLARIPASHLALYSKATWRRLIGELRGQRQPTFGLKLVQHGARLHAARLYEGGPAAAAGIRSGDRIVALDGVSPWQSPRLDWRGDDAYLDDLPDYEIRCEPGDRVVVDYERSPGEIERTTVTAAAYSGLDAAEASARVIERDGRRLGYLHFWFVHFGGCAAMLRKKLEGELAGCDGLVLDLRGRGGSVQEVRSILAELRRIHRDGLPIAALIDGETRSGKEVIADGIRRDGLGILVGERTAGAVLPASFVELGGDAVLMLPAAIELGVDLEGEGVPPDVAVAAAGPYSAGADPILEAGVKALGARLGAR